MLADAQIGGFDVSRETISRLDRYESLVRRWNPRINLVSTGSLSQLRQRHTHDSAQLLQFCPPGATDWVDLGSGGGFPGMVLAILAYDTRPELKLTLVESDARKATFLRLASQELGVQVAVITDRIEAIDGLLADVVSARALAPLKDLLNHAHRHLGHGGLAVLPKGQRYREELDEAQRVWRFEAEAHPSKSDPNSAIILIRNIERAEA